MRADTLLYRQVHPHFVAGGQLTSQAFLPFPKDDGELSAYDGSLISAAKAFEHYTQALRFESVAVYAVSKAEADSEGVPAESQPLENFPEHAKIDFNQVPQKTWRKVAKKLKIRAIERGCQFSPEDERE
ncbi:MAG: hypothetical protein ACLFU4_01320 [Opitutales bacterium]